MVIILEERRQRRAAARHKKMEEAAVKSAVHDYSGSVSRLEKKVIAAQAKKYDPSVTPERFDQAWLHLKGTVDENRRKDFIERTTKETGYAPSEDIVNRTMKRDMGSFNYYNSLLSSASELEIDYEKGENYEQFLAEKLKRETPIQEESASFWGAIKNFGKGAISTTVGASLMGYDAVTGNNSYNKYFYDGKNADITGFKSKADDLLFKQGAWFDVLVGSMALIPPVAAVMGAGAFFLRGGIKGVTKSGLKTMTRKGLKRGLISESTAKSFKEIAKLEGEDFTKALMKSEGEISQLFKNPRKLRSKKATVVNTIGDTLDIPGLYTFGQFADKAGGGLQYTLSPFNIVTRGGLAMAGEFIPAFTNTITRGADELAGWTAKHMQIGLVEKERQAFIQEHDIDPEEATGALKESWEQNVNYKIRNAGFLTTLTGYQPEKDDYWTKFIFGAVDGTLNFGIMGGIMKGAKRGAVKGWDKSFGIKDKESQAFIEKIISGEDIKSGFFKEVKVIKALSEAQKNLESQWLQTTGGLAEGEKQVLFSELMKVKQEIKNNNPVKAGEIFKDLTRKLTEASNFQSTEKMKVAVEKVKRLGEYANKQNTSGSRLAKFRMEAARMVFSAKQTGDVAEAAVKGNTTKLQQQAANEATQLVNIPEKMTTIFKRSGIVGLKVGDLFDTGESLPNIIGTRLNVLLGEKFTDSQKTEIKKSIGQQLHTRMLEIGLTTSKFKNKDLAKVVNEILNKNFGTVLSKRLLAEKLTDYGAKDGYINEKLDSLLTASNIDLIKTEKKFSKEIGQAKKILEQKVLQLRAVNDTYAKLLSQKNQADGTNELLSAMDPLFADLNIKNDDLASKATVDQLTEVGKETRVFYEKLLEESKTVITNAQKEKGDKIVKLQDLRKRKFKNDKIKKEIRSVEDQLQRSEDLSLGKNFESSAELKTAADQSWKMIEEAVNNPSMEFVKARKNIEMEGGIINNKVSKVVDDIGANNWNEVAAAFKKKYVDKKGLSSGKVKKAKIELGKMESYAKTWTLNRDNMLRLARMIESKGVPFEQGVRAYKRLLETSLEMGHFYTKEEAKAQIKKFFKVPNSLRAAYAWNKSIVKQNLLPISVEPGKSGAAPKIELGNIKNTKTSTVGEEVDQSVPQSLGNRKLLENGYAPVKLDIGRIVKKIGKKKEDIKAESIMGKLRPSEVMRKKHDKKEGEKDYDFDKDISEKLKAEGVILLFNFNPAGFTSYRAVVPKVKWKNDAEYEAMRTDAAEITLNLPKGGLENLSYEQIQKMPKYARLFMANDITMAPLKFEVSPERTTVFGGRSTDDIAHIIYRDPRTKAGGNPLSDGMTLVTQAYMDSINAVIGAPKDNTFGKTHLHFKKEEGGLIKHGCWLLQPSDLGNPRIIEAIKTAVKPAEGTVLHKLLNADLTSSVDQKSLLDEINRTNAFDALSSETTVKLNKSAKVNEVSFFERDQVRVKNQQSDAESAFGNISSQVFNRVIGMSEATIPLAKQFHEEVGNIIVGKVDGLVKEIKEVVNGESYDIGALAEKFDIHLDELQMILNAGNATQIRNMAAKFITRSLRGIPGEAQRYYTKPVMNKQAQIGINTFLNGKFKNFQEDNFIVVERTKELERIRNEYNGRVNLNRNPCDSAKSIAMPWLAFRDEIAPLSNSNLNGTVLTTQKVITTVKGDYDGDPVSIPVGSDFNKLNPLLAKLSDEYQKLDIGANVDLKATEALYSEADRKGMTNYDMLRGHFRTALEAKDSIQEVLGAQKKVNILAGIQDKEGNPIFVKNVGALKELDKIGSDYANSIIDGKGTKEGYYKAVSKWFEENINIQDTMHFNLKTWGNDQAKLNQTAKLIHGEIKEKLKAKNKLNLLKDVKVNLTPLKLTIGDKEWYRDTYERVDTDTKISNKDTEFLFKIGDVSMQLGGKKALSPSSNIVSYRPSRILSTIQGILEIQGQKAGGGFKGIEDFSPILSSKERVNARERYKKEGIDKFFEGSHELANRSLDFHFGNLKEMLGENTMNNFNYKLAEKLLDMQKKGEFNFLSRKNVLYGNTPTIQATKSAQNEFEKGANLDWYKHEGIKEESMTPQQKISSVLKKISTQETLPTERRAGILEILEIKKSLSPAEKANAENFILSKYGITGTTNHVLSVPVQTKFNIAVRETMMNNAHNTKMPADLRKFSELLADGNLKEIEEGEAIAIKELEEKAEQVSEKNLKLTKDIKNILDDKDSAKNLMDFVLVLKKSGLDETMKDNPDYEIFRKIGQQLVDTYGKTLRDSFDTMKNESMEPHTTLDVNTGELRVAKNKLANETNREVDQLQQKVQAQRIIQAILNKSADAQMKQEEITKIFANDAMHTMEKMLADSQKLVIDSSDITTSNRKVQKMIDRHLYKTSQEMAGFDTTKAVYDFYTKLYKSVNVGIAVGRVVSESIQTKFMALVDNLSKGKYKMIDPVKFQTAVDSAVPGGKAPKAGTFKGMFDDQQKRASLLKIDEAEVNKLIQSFRSGTKRITNIVAGSTYGKLISKEEQKFYASEFMTKTWDQYNRMVGRGENGSILFRTKLTVTEIGQKNKIMQKIRRDATKKTNEVFFGDYGSHPLIIQKMEDVMPFSNFLFTGMKMINRYPKAILAASSLLTSMQNQFGEEIFAMDEEGNRLAVGKRWGFPLLGFMGMGNTAINVQRMLQISPADMGGQAYPLLGYLQGNHDWRIRKYYKEVADGKPNAFGWLMASSVSPVFEHLTEFGTTGHPSALVNGLGYYATGFVMKDRTQSDMIGKYFNGDYKELLDYNNLAFNEFADNKMFKNNPPTKNSVRALMKAEELGLLGDKQNPYDKIMRAMSLSDLSHLPKEDQDKEKLVMKNGIDLILGKKIYGNDFDKNWLDKVKEFSESEHYEEFNKMNPAYAKTIDHYIEYFDYYKNLYDACSLAYGDKSSPEEKADGYLTLTALRYKFEGEDEVLSHISNLNQKKNMIKEGKLNTLSYDLVDNIPQLTSNYEAALDRKGILVEMYTKGVAKAEAAGQMKMVYYSLAQTSLEKKDKNTYWNKFNKQQIIQENQEAMLRDLITTDKDTFIDKHSKNIKPELGELYFMRHKNRREPKPTKTSYSNRLQYANMWEKSIKDDKISGINSKLEKLHRLSPTERAYYISIGVNPSSIAYSLKKQLKAETITPQMAEAIIEGHQLGNINL